MNLLTGVGLADFAGVIVIAFCPWVHHDLSSRIAGISIHSEFPLVREIFKKSLLEGRAYILENLTA